jgi:hypothetical protein
MRSSRTVIALACLAAALVPVAGAHAATGSRFRVTATVPTTNVVGRAMKVHGRVSPHAGGTHVRIQVRAPGATAFHTLRTAYVHRNGRYHAWVTATRPGVTRYRVVEPAGRGHRRGRSPVRLVTVSQWRTIASLPTAPGQAHLGTISPVASADLNGAVYAPALDQTFDSTMQEGLVVYDLRRSCTRLSTWVGAAPPGAGDNPTYAYVYVGAGSYDAQQLPTVANVNASPEAARPTQIVLGPDALATADVLALDIRQGTATPFTVEWGDPKILCSF